MEMETIKRLVVMALTSDDMFIGLVLKGGNALQLGYDITSRGSIDIDFSMSGDFKSLELGKIAFRAELLLNKYFKPEGLFAFDVSFKEKPEIKNVDISSFWGGYSLDFKIIEIEKIGTDITKLRREALSVLPNSGTVFKVDISKHEFIKGSSKKDIGGAIVEIYSPEMLAFEKIRALCQQMKEYKSIVLSFTSKSRARDFFDIYNLTEQFNIIPRLSDNVELAKSIFAAKRVPLEYIQKLPEYREHHRNSWDSVLQTISADEKAESFDFYFDYVIGKYNDLFTDL